MDNTESNDTPMQLNEENQGKVTGSVFNIAFFIILGLIIVFLIAYFALTRTDAGRRLLGRANVTPTPTAEPTPTSRYPEESQEATPTPAPLTPTPTVTNDELRKTTNKTFIGQSNNYSVYLINVETNESQKKGQIAILNSGEDKLIKFSGAYTIKGSTLVSKQGNYLSLASGTDSKRNEILISLKDNKVVISSLCLIGQPIIWKDSYVIYNSCTTFDNRPWSSHIAPSIDARNIKTGVTQVLLKSDELQHFGIKSVSNNKLEYYRTYTDKSIDWSNKDQVHTATASYDLSKL